MISTKKLNGNFYVFCVAVEKSKSPEKTSLKLRRRNQNSIKPHVIPIAGSETGPKFGSGR